MKKESNVDNRKIAKNTLFLYFRMLLLMALSLYTSRVVLKVLGVDDYGIYNVVGGVISVLGFLKTSMASATQRFLNYEMGLKEKGNLRSVFSTAQVIHLAIAISILILCEIFGVWFLNKHMVIAPDRLTAANWVLQFSLLTFLVSVISVPYNAAIISHEKMSVFAYISIFEAVLKLIIVYILVVFAVDKLILYSILHFLIAVIIRFSYSIYCRRYFEECRGFGISFDKSLIKKMLGFSSWTIFGSLGTISHTQGIGIVLNLFFGVAVNAAQGISHQVIGALNQFVHNFMMALNPQIVKSYAAQDLESMHTLIKRGSRMGFCLIAFFAVPILMEIPTILDIWLDEVPEYTDIFIRIVLITQLCNSFSSPLSAAKGATGDIKNYQLIITTIGWMHLPLAWIAFELGGEPYYAMLIYLVLTIIMQMCRIHITCNSIKMSKMSFYKEVIARSFFMFFVAMIIPYIIHHTIKGSMTLSLINIAIGFICASISIFTLGITSHERKILLDFVKNKISKIHA